MRGGLDFRKEDEPKEYEPEHCITACNLEKGSYKPCLYNGSITSCIGCFEDNNGCKNKYLSLQKKKKFHLR